MIRAPEGKPRGFRKVAKIEPFGALEGAPRAFQNDCEIEWFGGEPRTFRKDYENGMIRGF